MIDPKDQGSKYIHTYFIKLRLKYLDLGRNEELNQVTY